MGSDKKVRPRYRVFKRGHWVWVPVRRMRKAGFDPVHLGAGYEVDGVRYMSAVDIDRARALNTEWDRYRRGLPPLEPRPKYPSDSVGDGYERAMKLREQERKAKGIKWTTDWPRAWKWLEPLFGDADPKTVTPEQLLELRQLVASKVLDREAYQLIKTWRALWHKMATLGYCDKELDPSFLFTNPAPRPRKDVWSEGEAVRLVKQAWRSGYYGLAAVLAVAWDTQLWPVDVRGLSANQRRRDEKGTWFEVDRAKTGSDAFGTLSARTEYVLSGYLARIGVELVGPIFRNRSGAPYSKDTLGDDFRDVRAIVFGEAEKRQLRDFRRSGTVEAFAGDATPESVSAKMSNTLLQSNFLHRTYSPVQLEAVRAADASRRLGRRRIRERKEGESFPPSGPKVSRLEGEGS
jgi:hypothetical protein